MPESRANAIAVMPRTKAHVRCRGTGLFGWSRSTRRTAHRHQMSETAIASVGSGSTVQPSRSDAAVGGSAGVGPCPSAGAAMASQDPAPRTVAAARTSTRRAGIVLIGLIVPRTGPIGGVTTERDARP